jgi:3,4-dihydroxy 2-butanone 4-phosphate synthase/GTP cyclohydrolase II
MIKLDSFEEILDDVRAGKPIVLIDDSDREDEGDIMIAAELVTAESVNFMITEARGLVCAAVTESRLRELNIPMQVQENTSLFGTNFGVSFDFRLVRDEGVSAAGRAETIRRLADPDVRPEDFSMPGYVYPVGARPGGVFRRRGQTEGSVDLSRIAGLRPAAVICEIMDSDGEMLRGQRLAEYCKEHQIKITSVQEIVDYRLRNEVSIRRVADVELSENSALSRGVSFLAPHATNDALRLFVFEDDVDGKEHFAIVHGQPENGSLVRIHSACLTGDIFDSARCDCGGQFDSALKQILHEGNGVLVYLQQEGRGIGLGNKLRAYELQDKGLDTVQANLELGFAPDERDYRAGAQILIDLGMTSIRLITNNPMKIESLKNYGVAVSERVALPVSSCIHNAAYLDTKRTRMGHLLPEPETT